MGSGVVMLEGVPPTCPRGGSFRILWGYASTRRQLRRRKENARHGRTVLPLTIAIPCVPVGHPSATAEHTEQETQA